MTAAPRAGTSPDRVAVLAFRGAVLLCVPLIAHLARDQWFVLDDWTFLRPAGSLSGSELLEPYWGHWTTVPRLWQSAMFSAVGLHHYLPYLLGTLAAHVACAWLLRGVMVRGTGDGWTATLLATFFLAFGPGAENVVVGFQVSMTGSLALGLAHLLLADHDGASPGRDVLAVLAGALAVMSTNVGLLTTAATGASVLCRRGWRAAVALTAPVAGLYAAWWAVVARTGDSSSHTASSFGTVRTQVAELLSQLATGSAPGPLGAALVVAVVVGAVLALRQLGTAERARLAPTLGLSAAALLLVPAVAYTRGGRLESELLEDFATPSRYLHLLVAFVLPAAAVACSALAARWRWGRAAVAVAVLACLPANLSGFSVDYDRDEIAGQILTMADVVGSYPSVVDEPVSFGGVSLHWLHESRRDGRIPAPPAGSDAWRDPAFAVWVVVPSPDLGTDGCRRLPGGATVAVRAGDRMVLAGPAGSSAVVTDVARDLRAEIPLAGGAAAVEVWAGPTELAVGSDAGPVTAWRCA